MVRALLTDNNEDKGKHGGFTAYHVGENWPEVAENYADMDSREYRRSITAHPSSVIGEICDHLEIPSHFHSLIAQKVISGFTKSIEEVLPGYKKMKKSLQDICDSQRKQNGDSGARLTWEVNDGCTITNVYLKILKWTLSELGVELTRLPVVRKHNSKTIGRKFRKKSFLWITCYL